MTIRLRTLETGARGSSPEDLHGAPEVEDEEDDRPVLHLLQTAEDHEEEDVPAGHLQRGDGGERLGR